MREERNDARSAALRVLRQMDRAAAWADAGLDAELRRSSLAGQEAALAARLVYGVLQNRALLDHLSGGLLLPEDRPSAKTLGGHPAAGGLSDRLSGPGAGQRGGEYLCGARPGTAAGARLSGLVNAVLRKVAANKENLPPVPEKDVVSYLATHYSHPKWLVQRLLSLVGREEAEALPAARTTPRHPSPSRPTRS